MQSNLLLPPISGRTKLSLLALLALGLFAGPASAQEPDTDLDRRRSPIVEVVERARPAVVSIDCSVGKEFSIFSTSSSGTGVVLYEDGILVTNYHVVFPEDRPANRITIRFDQSDDATLYRGEVISFEKSEDLALVKIEGAGPFPTVEMSDDAPLLGETVVAIGNAIGRSHTVSSGIISGLHRNLEIPERGLNFRELLQTDAAINLGNSGGPLLNIVGELVGINTAVTRNAENVGYAIPVSRVQSVLKGKLLDTSRSRAYLGMVVDEATQTVRQILSVGPAAQAGLQTGDRITAIDGKSVGDVDSYNLQRVAISTDARVQLDFERGGKNRTAELTTWDAVQGTIHRSLGVTLEPVWLGRSRDQFLWITSVDENGPAGRIGLQPKDVITAIRPNTWRRGRRFEDRVDLAMLLVRLAPETTLEVEVLRDDNQDGQLERNGDMSELYRGLLRMR